MTAKRCWTMVFFLLAGAGCPPMVPAFPSPSTCESLDTLVLGKEIHVGAPPPGNSFQPPTMDIGVRPFTFRSGATTSAGVATVENGGRAGGTLNEIHVNNILITVSRGFGHTLKGLRLSFGEYGGNLNVSVNNTLVNFADFNNIGGTIIGSVVVKLISGGGGNDKGVIEFVGNMVDQASGLGQLAIGGQELWVDDICFAE